MTTPNDVWTSAQTAYGTMSLSGTNVTVTGTALNGSQTGTETVPISCHASKSEWDFTNLDGRQHKGALSPSGLFVNKGGEGGAVGMPKATSNIAVLSGQTYLGLLVESRGSVMTRTVGFRSGASALSGFDPLTSGQPSNGIAIVLGLQVESGLFTGGTLTEGGDTDANFVAIAGNIGGRIVLYGITFDATRNTPVSVLLMQQ